ncbi:MAG: immunoglobulin domain-containing protein [Phycisphaeraceae bacterium]|nr:immunoglobulin domain-containing protein [Phycisphaerales bacterium]MCB9859977.1 immunoglobulin domain-containing protein [Phycisphaeraceae bacterium]
MKKMLCVIAGCIFFAVATLPSRAQTVVNFGPKKTYLHCNQDPNANDPLIINLGSSGFFVGERIRIRTLGAFLWNSGNPLLTGSDATAIFSSTTNILNKPQPDRVPDKIPCGAPQFTTPLTFHGGESTNIDHDFRCTDIIVKIPPGAGGSVPYLVCSPYDEFFGDNVHEPNNTFQIEISHQPPTSVSVGASSTLVCPGSSITLTANGGDGGTIRWYASSTCSGTQLGTGSSINVIVNGSGTITARSVSPSGLTSNCANVSIDVIQPPTAPTAVQPPPTCVGQTVLLRATNTGGNTVYWYNSCGGAQVGIGATLPVQATAGATYVARTRNSCNQFSLCSNQITLSTLPPPASVTIAPTVTSVCEGQPVTLTAFGTSGQQVRWYRNSNCSGTPFATGPVVQDFPTTTTTYTAHTNAGQCGVGPCSNAVTVSVNTSVNAGQTVPQNALGCPGGSVTFSVNPVGSPPYSFQWLFEGSPITPGAGISGINTSMLQLQNTQLSQAGMYSCRVTSVCGVDISTPGELRTCYADCDCNLTLNIFDYVCYGNAYANADPYADCDGSGTLNIFDYICFGNEYSAGCQ